MHRFFACAVLIVLACATAGVLGECIKPTISQTRQTAWTDGLGVSYSVWEGAITADANTISSVLLSVDTSSNPAAIDNLWELTPQSSLWALPQWRLQNGGIPQGQAHRFGYTIKSASAANFQVASWTCPGAANPSTAPSTQPASPSTQPASPSASPAAPSPSASSLPASPSASPAPANPSASPSSQPPVSTVAVCQSVLVVDNWVRRNLPQMSVQQIADKYTAYWGDINKFYLHNFNVDLNLTYVYVEDGSSFSETLDGDELLNQFNNGLKNGIFTGVPRGACIYHLITGRNPYGIGGLAWIGAACSESAAGFSVDGQGDDPGSDVIGRSIHEIGHNLGGNHPDGYPREAGFTCSIDQDREQNRILRDDSTPDYEFLNPLGFISECASLAIKSSLSAFSCMWSPEETQQITPRAVLCTEENGQGDCLTVAAREGLEPCYNVMPINDKTSSYQVFPGTSGVVGLQLFYDTDCVGSQVAWRQLNSATMPPGFDNQITSFKFITH